MFHLIKKFFWTCAGATISLLDKKECETEHSKYVGIGATILTTAILAGVSGSYAFFIVFKSVEWAVIFGCFWGLMIFNLDRYIVLSIKNQEPPSIKNQEPLEAATLRGWLDNFGRRLLVALPRIVLAALLAVVIAKPLELKLFEKEIALEMTLLRKDKIDEYKRKNAAAQPGANDPRSSGGVDALKQRNKDLQTEIDEAWKRYDERRQIAQDEADGKSVRRAGEGVVFKEKQTAAKAMFVEYEKVKKNNDQQIEANNKEIVRQQESQNEQAKKNEDEALTTDGIATQLECFSRLKAKNYDVYLANLVIMLLILMLEVAPILTKFLAGYGPYDKMVEAAERRVFIEKQIEIETLEGEARRRLDSHRNTQQTMLDVQDTFFDEVRIDARNLKPNSATQSDWEDAKNAIIEKAVHDLRSNGHDK
jgi:hypothetical protein